MQIGECADLSCDCLRSTGLDQWAIQVPLGGMVHEAKRRTCVGSPTVMSNRRITREYAPCLTVLEPDSWPGIISALPVRSTREWLTDSVRERSPERFPREFRPTATSDAEASPSAVPPGFDRRPQSFRYLAGDVVLDHQDVAERPVVGFRPDNVSVVRPNQACGDAQRCA
jgi:hypothetical protein